MVCITLPKEVGENKKDFGEEGYLLVIDGQEQYGNMNSEGKNDRMDDDGNNVNGDGIFIDCNGFDVSDDNSRRIDGELHTDEPCSRNIKDDNDIVRIRIVFGSVSLLHCRTPVRI